MSRGNREAASGNLKGSMRDNYSEHGVDEYYRKVGATYRNPHFPGVRSCLFLWLNRWWQAMLENSTPARLVVFDMACGNGEVTMAVLEWWRLGRRTHDELQPSPQNDSGSEQSKATKLPRRNASPLQPPPIGPQFTRPTILAADPYTTEAYRARTSLSCASLSFREIAEGALPAVSSPVSIPAPPNKDAHEDSTQGPTSKDDASIIDMVICSFALHLIETPSELFSLLWELSTKCRWLIILAPHKKPDIKDGWGWHKWNVETWSECPTAESRGSSCRRGFIVVSIAA